MSISRGINKWLKRRKGERLNGLLNIMRVTLGHHPEYSADKTIKYRFGEEEGPRLEMFRCAQHDGLK